MDETRTAPHSAATRPPRVWGQGMRPAVMPASQTEEAKD